MGSITPGLGRLNLGEVARVQKCLKCLGTENNVVERWAELCLQSFARESSLYCGREALLRDRHWPKHRRAGHKIQILSKSNIFYTHYMHLLLISYERYYFLAVFDILFMDLIQPISSQQKSNFACFFPKQDLQGSLGRSLRFLHAGCFRFGLSDQDR